MLGLGLLAAGVPATSADAAPRPPASVPKARAAHAAHPLPKVAPLPPPRPMELLRTQGEATPAVPGPPHGMPEGVPGVGQDGAAPARAEPATAAPAPLAFPPLFGVPPAQEESAVPSEGAAGPRQAAGASVKVAVPLPTRPPGRAPSVSEASQAPGAAASSATGELPAVCAGLVEAGLIVAAPERGLQVKDGCSLPAPVRLEAVRMADGRVIALKPAAILRCGMVKAVADWVREDLVPMVDALGQPAEAVRVAASFGCRPRNNVKGAKVSEHGFGNAIDIGGFEVQGGDDLEVRNGGLSVPVQTSMKASACRRFTTVLGPGSDGYHEDHIHVDLAQRRGGYRLCHWVIKDRTSAPPPLPTAKPAEAAGKVPSDGAGEKKGAGQSRKGARGGGQAGTKTAGDKAEGGSVQ